MKKTEMTSAEIETLNRMIHKYLKPDLHHLGSDREEVARYDKRDEMYGGSGTVYLLQMFQPGELVNNRIGAYMVLPENGVSAGFHTHGTRSEQELYVVFHGSGEYYEKATWESDEVTHQIMKGSVTTVRGDAFHSVKNTGNEPLIIFVITTNEPGGD